MSSVFSRKSRLERSFSHKMESLYEQIEPLSGFKKSVDQSQLSKLYQLIDLMYQECEFIKREN